MRQTGKWNGPPTHLLLVLLVASFAGICQVVGLLSDLAIEGSGQRQVAERRHQPGMNKGGSTSQIKQLTLEDWALQKPERVVAGLRCRQVSQLLGCPSCPVYDPPPPGPAPVHGERSSWIPVRKLPQESQPQQQQQQKKMKKKKKTW